MVTHIRRVVAEVEKLAGALDLPPSEFGQRAMRTSILSTSYNNTRDAIDKSKISYRRALNLKLGTAVAEVFETLPLDSEGEIQFDSFLERTINAYMRLCGIPFIERYFRQAEIRGQVLIKLERTKALGQIETFTRSNQKFVKILPEVSETAFAMLMDPESMLRSPYVKAMAQTIGAMAIVDGSPERLTQSELASSVQDGLNKHHLLEAIKPAYAFAAKNIEPFHQKNKVGFYSDKDGRLFILPTYPRTGSTTFSQSDLPVILNAELAFEHLGSKGVRELTGGLNPPLVPMTSGDRNFYFNRHSRYMKELETLLGASFSKFIPKNETALAALNALQSKLGKEFGDGRRVSRFIDSALRGSLKESDLHDFDKRVMSVLMINLGLIKEESDNIYVPADDRSHSILEKLKALCSITDPIGPIFSQLATREKE